MYNIDEKPEVTDLICPNSGFRLMAEPVERWVMDPSHFYFAEGAPNFRYERHPFSWMTFRQIHGGDRRMGSKVIKWWKLNHDRTWTEMMEVEGVEGIIPLDTPQSEIDLLKEINLHKKRIAQLEYEARLASGAPLLPIAKKVEARTISSDLVAVKPMKAPSGDLFVIQPDYNSYQIQYPFKVNDENIQVIREQWNLEKYKQHKVHGDIMIGDTIDEWKHGGPMSMRAGEMVVRDGIEIYSRLTRMS